MRAELRDRFDSRRPRLPGPFRGSGPYAALKGATGGQAGASHELTFLTPAPLHRRLQAILLS